MNNSIYGKTCENLRKRVDVRLVTDQKNLSTLTSKPTYVNSKIFTEDLVAVHKIKESLKLDRPAYVGMHSLCYEIETKDIYKDLWEDKQLFDNSNYPKDSPYFSVENKKVIGKFK
ncbi:unnamed protein product, partial [Porites lobata]